MQEEQAAGGGAGQGGQGGLVAFDTYFVMLRWQWACRGLQQRMQTEGGSVWHLCRHPSGWLRYLPPLLLQPTSLVLCLPAASAAAPLSQSTAPTAPQPKPTQANPTQPKQNKPKSTRLSLLQDSSTTDHGGCLQQLKVPICPEIRSEQILPLWL